MFLLNLQSKIPINEQIQTQILKFIEAGILKPNDRLPSVRQLASDIGINPNTVARAYAELEQSGVVYNIPKKGVYVQSFPTKETDPDVPIREVIRSWKERGVEAERIQRIVSEVYQEEDTSC